MTINNVCLFLNGILSKTGKMGIEDEYMSILLLVVLLTDYFVDLSFF